MALLLTATGRPIATDDSWWHLALGRVFIREGPWLSADPLLFTATQPASTASWLADVLLAQMLAVGGFTGLRISHVVCVALLLALAGALLRREAASNGVAALALTAFATLAAYRLFQLRPELATILATLLLYALVLRPRAGPTATRIALYAITMALWANLHAAFLLGPLLVVTALAGIAGAALVAGPERTDRVRIQRLLLAAVLGTLATLANPSGVDALVAYFQSGQQSPALTLVGDEWRPFEFFSWRGARVPPSRADKLLVWGLVAGTLASTTWAIGARRTRARAPAAAGADPPAEIDPALVALAWAALAAMIVAVRFLWLAIFPLLLLAQTAAVLRPRVRARYAIRWLPALLGPALLASFVWIGPWPRISDVVRASPGSYPQPYAAEKYFADSIWLIRDAGLEGHLFTAYELGGFAGFWLTPKIQTYINGSLNVSPEIMSAYFAIQGRRGMTAGESFPDLLDRLGVDLFLGTGTPEPRPARSTTAHLERTPGWVTVFRNATSAVYLRVRARDNANLRRIADFYRREGVPFDLDLGFEPDRVIREQPGWAIRHAVIPEDFEALEREVTRTADPRARLPALIRTASLYAMLGSYDTALAREAELRELDPGAVGPRHRTVWCLLRAGRFEEARVESAALEGREDRHGLLRNTVELAQSLPALNADEAQARIRRLPLLTTAQSLASTRMLRAPPARER